MSTKGKVSIAAFVGAAFLAGVLFATVGANLFGVSDSVGTSGHATTLNGSTTVSQESPAPGKLQTAFTDVAKSVNPAVIQIRAEKVVERRVPNPFQGTPFEDFFGGPGGPQQKFRSQGLGSGVIVRSDGHIVTNNHVVENADELSVVTFDGTQYDAKVVGTDPFSDIAVIKIDASDLTAISFGNSDQLKTGQWVLAFGSPLSQELQNSVTAGIVSSLGRLRPTGRGQQSGAQNFIQTDAAINPGNSGGPLVNLNGELVGINTAIATQTGGYQGIGFAVPSNTVERVATQIIEEGSVQRAYLGISYQGASKSLIQNEDLPQGSVIIRSVQEGTPAAEAGLQSGDVITAVDGQPLKEALQVQSLIASKQPGDEVELRVLKRDGSQETVTVTLASREEQMAAADEGGDEGGVPSDMMEELGLSVRNVTPEIARQLGLDDTNGVVITNVDPSNPAIRNSGLQPKQIIIGMAGEKIANVEQFEKVYESIEPGEAFRVIVRSPEGYVSQTSLRKPSNGE